MLHGTELNARHESKVSFEIAVQSSIVGLHVDGKINPFRVVQRDAYSRGLFDAVVRGNNNDVAIGLAVSRNIYVNANVADVLCGDALRC